MKRLIWVLVLALALCLTGACMAEEAENAVDPRIEAFFDTWSCEGHAIEIWQEEDGSLSAYASSDISETEHYRWDYTGMTLDEAEGTLVCDGKGVKTHRTVVEGQDELQIEELAGDLCRQEGLVHLAGRYASAAQDHYSAWGAAAKASGARMD